MPDERSEIRNLSRRDGEVKNASLQQAAEQSLTGPMSIYLEAERRHTRDSLSAITHTSRLPGNDGGDSVARLGI